MLHCDRPVDAVKERGLNADYLEFALYFRGWRRVPSLIGAVKEFADIGRQQAISPRAFKRVLLEAHNHLDRATLGRVVGNAYVDEIQNVSMFLSSRVLSWQTISDFGASQLVARHGRKRKGPYDYFVSLGQLMIFAREINLVLGWSRPATLPRYCDLCWRVSVTSRPCCPVHSATTTSDHAADDRMVQRQPALARDTYWYAHRPAFRLNVESETRKLVRVDRQLGLRTMWKGAVEAGKPWVWVARHRPEVFLLLSDQAKGGGGDAPLTEIVTNLDFVPNERPRERRLRTAFHEYLAQDPVAIFDMILRAESWLLAANLRQSKWGGARLNAGRPTSPPR